MNKLKGLNNASLLFAFAMVFTSFGSVFYVSEAGAHGERNQEPFLRMRTLHWYDVEFKHADGRPFIDGEELKVNEEFVMTGKVRFFGRWPRQLPPPELVYLNAASPGPVFVKKETWLNGKPAIQSSPAVLGRDYDFKVVLVARVPGKHHIHPMINVKDASGLVGPGIWTNVTGSWEDFTYPVKTLTGQEVEDLDVYGLEGVRNWTLLWVGVALFWLLWWFRKPLIIPRGLLVKAKRESSLVTATDKKVAIFLLAGIVFVVIFGAKVTSEKYPRTIPLQAGIAEIDPLPLAEESVKTDVKSATYYLPGRTVKVSFEVTNNSSQAVRLGEFSSANLRFIDKSFSRAIESVTDNYPEEYIPKNGLLVNDRIWIHPGETQLVSIEATDAAWEVERLSSFMHDPDSTFGALLIFYSDENERYVSELYGPIVPTFQD
uniref:Methane monooxygenase protein B1 n=1 Tax=Methylococcaceae bacterium ET-SHO TaxID=557142 RepID=B9X089_9GAMM|nr:methane monooxygenase protein B1 [Methylococcaceae bacterium ET-SHO]